jgi:hypothetical protein
MQAKVLDTFTNLSTGLRGERKKWVLFVPLKHGNTVNDVEPATLLKNPTIYGKACIAFAGHQPIWQYRNFDTRNLRLKKRQD